MQTPYLPTIAIVMPCFNEEACIESSVKAVKEVLEGLIVQNKISKNSFLYFVDDGSTDTTWKEIEKLHKLVPGIKATKLSRNFGHQVALLSGLNAVTNLCDAAISIDVDLQQDPQAINKFVGE